MKSPFSKRGPVDVVAAVLLATQIVVGAPHGAPASPAECNVVFVLDGSSSMDDDRRLETLKEAAKLGTFLLDGRVRLIHFSDEPIVSDDHQLPSQLSEVCEWIDAMKADGNTNYLPALQAAGTDASAIVFVSDGAPGDPLPPIYEYLRSVHAPIHTIAVSTSPDAEELLAQIAAATQGGFQRTAEPAGVVDAFLSVLGQIRRFRRYDARGSLELQDLQGEIVVISQHSPPCFSDSGKLQTHVARLGGTEIHVARAVIAATKSLTVSVSDSGPAGNAALTVLRFDLTTSSMSLQRVAETNGKVWVRAETRFFDESGQVVDPRHGKAELSAAFELVDPKGAVIQRTAARPSSAGPALEAVLGFPDDGKTVPYHIRNITVHESGEARFAAVERRAVNLESLPVAPPPEAKTMLWAECDQQSDTLRCRVEIEAVGDEELRQEFLEALAEDPPVLVVKTPDQRTIDSASGRGAFTVQPSVPDGAKTSFEFAFRPADVPGTYAIEVCEGTAGPGRYPAAHAKARCLSGSEIELRVVAHKRSGPKVIYSSPQNWSRPALVGDSLSCELVRGTMNPRMFASLGPGLVAKWIQRDGAIQTVKLRFESDRYVTEAIPMQSAGILRVQVDVAVESLQIHYEGQIDIVRVDLRLAIPEQPFFGRLERVPQGLLLPLRAAIEGTVGAEVLSEDDLMEVLDRDQVSLEWVLTDSTGKPLDSAVHDSPQRPWATAVWLRHPGRQELSLQIIDGKGTIHDGIRWRFEGIEAPFAAVLKVRQKKEGWEAPTPRSRLASFLPRWFVSKPQCVMAIVPKESDFATAYYLAGATVNEAEARFDDESGWHVHPVNQDGEVTCVCRLKPYGFGSSSGPLPELQVMTKANVEIPRSVRPVRLAIALLLGLLCVTAAAVGLARTIRRRSLEPLIESESQIVLVGSSYDAQPLVDIESSFWPTARLLVCRSHDRSPKLRLVRPSQPHSNDDLVADVRGESGARIRVVAMQDLPTLSQGQSFRLEPGNETIPIDETTSLALEQRSPTAG